MASKKPVRMPFPAAGRITLKAVFHSGPPNASEASRRLWGTSLSISSVARTIVGSIKIANAMPPAKAE